MKIVAMIPARYAATRFPAKLMQLLGDKTVIRHTHDNTLATGLFDDVFVVTDSEIIYDEITNNGGKAVMSKGQHESGSDRIAEAVLAIDVDVIVNVQGDLPTIDPKAIAASVLPLANPEVDLATLVVEITRDEEKTNPNVVKPILTPLGDRHYRALYFTRVTAPSGEGPLYHHIGLYAWRRRALARFVSLQPSTLEKRERLEQLRALEAGMRIDAIEVDDVPLGVDTPEDLERARLVLANRPKMH